MSVDDVQAADDVQATDDVQAAIEQSLADGPSYAEQLMAKGMPAVALEGDLIARLSPDGSRTVMGSITTLGRRQP